MDVSLVAETTGLNHTSVRVKTEAYKRGLFHSKISAWSTGRTFDLDEFKDRGYSIFGSFLYDGGTGELVLDQDDELIQLHLRGTNLTATVYGKSADTADQHMRFIRTYFKAIRINTEKQIKATFWFMGTNGPENTDRAIDAPTWEDLRGNYGVEAESGLQKLLGEGWRPDQKTNGQLLVWHGPPGTGKTYAIRSICREWQDWCRMSYITDPEAFLGTAHYLMEVLMDEEASYDEVSGAHQFKRPWNLIVLEDAGELVGKDAKTRTGQGLSRLLNVTDGMVGQGLKVLVLITTNEEATSLHDAINRPGRCLSRINFDRLNLEQSKAWAERNGLTQEVTQGHSLAELYAMQRGVDLDKRKAIGFGR